MIKLKYLGIDTYKDPVIYMRQDCHVCISEGFETHTRIKVKLNGKAIIATLNTVNSDLLNHGEAALSDYAWDLLEAKEGDKIKLSHPKPLSSLSYLRSKIYGNELKQEEIVEIVKDISQGRYSDIHISSFVTACAGGKLNEREIVELTEAMVEAGDKLNWESDFVVDKHCVGGLPGNRTTPIIAAIVAAYGLTMPKTSSRAITSPAGTADTMEVLAPVELDIKTMQAIVNKEGACIAWGGSIALSPADDILIRVEKALDIDSEGQLIASVLSKKIAAGSTHIVMDIPVGPTAKVRTNAKAFVLKKHFESIGKKLGLEIKVLITDGTQPIGNGIGPALEARDLVAVLKCETDAAEDLKERALVLAASILEFSSDLKEGEGYAIAKKILESGRAWEKFKAICTAQGGMREIPQAPYSHTVKAESSGIIININNRSLALLAKLAGAPEDKVAGLDLHVKLGSIVNKGDPLYTICSESIGELDYALDSLKEGNHILEIKEQ